ncbi:DUF6153 family protein [Nocardia miyunensis]|uniref:DUF6153 family protein n=1 Tax=Nocardia miyunensis TaxID=282684 RepID=UPI000830D6C7|nr:DUF6153 family protein [Nocardia miyunensis]
MSRRPEDLATGCVRVAGLLMLLIGIVVMHIFVAAHASAHSSEHLAAQSNSQHSPAKFDEPTARFTPDLYRGHAAISAVTPAAADISATPRAAADIPAMNPRVTTATATRLAPDSHHHRSTITEADASESMANPGTTAARHDPASMMAAPASMMPGGHMDMGCANDCCVMRGGMHACVFILTALVLLLGLAFLGRVGDDAAVSTRTVRGWAARHARPPPWTTPSLAELSILRI